MISEPFEELGGGYSGWSGSVVTQGPGWVVKVNITHSDGELKRVKVEITDVSKYLDLLPCTYVVYIKYINVYTTIF